jgi:signal transduction histidine kinase
MAQLRTGARKQPETPTNIKNRSVPILAINDKGTVTKANTAAQKLLARRPDDIDESRIEGLSISSLIAQLLSMSANAELPSLAITNARGERRDVLLALSESEQAEPQGEPADGGRGAALTQGELQASRLADFIAHELRNPLGTILGFAQILRNRDDLISSADRTTALATIHSEAERALLILDSLLRLAEGRTKTKVETTSIPLHAVILRVIEGHRRRHPERWFVVSGDSPLFATANSLWVELALANLLSNAEKYTPRDRQIEVKFHQHGSKATISVLDNGVALPEERYTRLWEIYGSPDPEVRVSGSGIGLALCKDLVERMGGQVWAGPRNAGGSVFSISLPVPWDMAVAKPLETRLAAMESGNGAVTAVESWAA